jgi:hypothetical protein
LLTNNKIKLFFNTFKFSIMRFILCVLLLFVCGLSIAHVTAAVADESASYLPADFDAGDIELANVHGTTLEDHVDLDRVVPKTSISGDICTDDNYQDNTGNILQAKTNKNYYVTANSYGLLYRTNTYNNRTVVTTHLVTFLDLPFEVGWFM